MSKFLTKVTQEYRVDKVEEATQLEKDLRSDNNFMVDQFSYKKKTHKYKVKNSFTKKTETYEEEYVVCKAKLIFNDEKEPCDYIDVKYQSNCGAWNKEEQ